MAYADEFEDEFELEGEVRDIDFDDEELNYYQYTQIIMSKETKTVYICPQCQSDNVQIKAWVRPNENNQYVDEVNEGDELGWCCDEELHAVIETAEVNADAKVIGFQVVGEDGTEQEGEIHRNMDASFCVYSLKQAQSMLSDKRNHSSVHDEQWRLLTIWTGDVEEPTKMFKGDPRD